MIYALLFLILFAILFPGVLRFLIIISILAIGVANRLECKKIARGERNRNTTTSFSGKVPGWNASSVWGEDDMAIYALWNNKGGVGKSYLTFQIASEYARTHPSQKVLVVDLYPQANASGMFLGGIVNGEEYLNSIAGKAPRQTIS